MTDQPTGRRAASVEAEALGHAVQVIAASERAGLSLRSVHAHLLPAVRLGQIEFAFNSHGRAIAYVSWAFVDDEVAAELAANPQRLLALPEWNEGTRLWIVDIVAFADRAAASLLLTLRRRLAMHDKAEWVRNGRPGSVRLRQSAIGERLPC